MNRKTRNNLPLSHRNTFNDFDKNFERAQKFAIGWFIFVAVLSLSLLTGGVFVVVKVLQHFGIL